MIFKKKIVKQMNGSNYATCSMRGRLGNNLFEIATVLGLSGMRPVFGSWKYKDVFDWDLVFDDRSCQGIIWNNYLESVFTYLPVLCLNGKNLKIHGYFQSYKYFDEETIMQKFKFKESIVSNLREKFKEYLPARTCSIHVRRADYLNDYPTHLTLGRDYYGECFDAVDFETDHYIVCSDDIEWCKENFVGKKFVFVEGQLDYEDMCLMSLCDNNIIANSTFSWWSAFLNANRNKKVLCPDDHRWFGVDHLNARDICPIEWVKI